VTAPELNNWAWQKLRALVLRTMRPVCGICFEPIDMTLSGRHRMGPTVHHLQPRSKGGAVYDRRLLVPAHNKCNAEQGNEIAEPVRSREW
jgi:5-methylcytosine-specific restriction endonuclease McrA